MVRVDLRIERLGIAVALVSERVDDGSVSVLCWFCGRLCVACGFESLILVGLVLACCFLLQCFNVFNWICGLNGLVKL